MPSPRISLPSLPRPGVALFFGLAAVAVTTPTWAAGALAPYLPKDGIIEGHVMTLGVAPQDAAINQRFRAAVASNMDWFRRAVTSNTAGKPLPYDPHMGISSAEYDRLLHMKADFRPGAAISIKIVRAKDGAVSFASDDTAAAGLDKVTFPAGDAVADTPYGKLAIYDEIHQDDARAPIGVWNGGEWARIAPPNSEQPAAKIAFGKREPSGEGVLYYQVAAYPNHEEQSLVVFYKLADQAQTTK